jgi:hypothetical protein
VSHRDNGGVFRPVARLAAGLVIAPFLLYGSSLAPLHVHEPDAQHSHAVAHSHFEPHHFESHESKGAELELGAELIVWLENATLHQSAYQGHPGFPLIAVPFEAIPKVSSWSATPFDDVAPVHGPPRRHPSFRGPPRFLS